MDFVEALGDAAHLLLQHEILLIGGIATIIQKRVVIRAEIIRPSLMIDLPPQVIAFVSALTQLLPQ